MRNKKLKQEEIENQEPDTKHNFALFVPEIKHNDWKEENGKVILCLKINDPVKKFLAWMVRRTPMTNLELDDRCSMVWKHMDGSRTVYDIAKLMAEKYKEDVNGELYRLVTYLKYLSKRGWIKFKEYEV
ncbi:MULTISPECIES: PqqD family protein [unclassified Clostridium]|uniref:PqqD family protein n=1 Tax=unclassified Clostridium TaxID=2614128 RepID=UPI000EEAF480|nr:MULTISPECIES: PqqD family protein [unclassified Clostridium]HCQ91174.1 PqqD family protein [Clostridium sp.]